MCVQAGAGTTRTKRSDDNTADTAKSGLADELDEKITLTRKKKADLMYALLVFCPFTSPRIGN